MSLLKVHVAQKVVSWHTEEKLQRKLRERMDISNLWEAWPVSGSWRLSPLLGGTNKRMWRVDAADGRSYVLCLSTDLDRAPRMRYEAQLLQVLEDEDPPFHLPVPLKATSGDILCNIGWSTLSGAKHGYLLTRTCCLTMPWPGNKHMHSASSKGKRHLKSPG